MNNKMSVPFEIRLEGVRKINQQLNMPTALAEGSGSVPAPTKQFKTAYNSSSRGSNIPFLASWGSCTHVVHIKSPCRNAHIDMKYNY